MRAVRFDSPIAVKTYDIDVAGHVNNIAYIRWIEDLRSGLLDSRFPTGELLRRHLYSVVTSTRIRYRNQLKLGEGADGSIWIDSINHGVMNLKVIFRKSGVIIATAEQSCVIMNLLTGKMDVKAMEVYV